MKFFIALIAFISLNASASTHLNFKCNFIDLTYINQFSVEVTDVHIQDGEFHNAEFDFTLRKAGRDSALERFAVTRNGKFKVFEAGSLYNHKVLHLSSSVKGDELESINLLLDVKVPNASNIRFLNGMTYFGSCKTF